MTARAIWIALLMLAVYGLGHGVAWITMRQRMEIAESAANWNFARADSLQRELSNRQLLRQLPEVKR